MILRADQYEQIVSHLRSERAAGRNAERRGTPRAGLRAQVQIIPCRTGVRARILPAMIRDVSLDGIGLIFAEPLDPGTYVVLILPASATSTLDVLFVITL